MALFTGLIKIGSGITLTSLQHLSLDLGFVRENAVSNQSKKRGGRPVQSSSTGGINGFINNNHLIDLGFEGNPYTWSNNRRLSENIKERLDKAYGNTQWRILFPDVTVTHLPGKSSDHLPILIRTHKYNILGPKPFRFVAAWTRDTTSYWIIKSAWRQSVMGSDAEILSQKTANTSHALQRWNVSHFGHIQTRLKNLSQKLNSIQQQESTIENLEIEKNLKFEIDEQCKKEESLWHKKSRVQWRTEGDLNTKFLHLCTLISRRRNAIDFIRNREDKWISSREEIGDCLISNFQNLFASSNPVFPADLQGLISPIISKEDRAMLCEIPSVAEISKTLMKFNPLNAPGPNGMPALFYKTYWVTQITDLDQMVTRMVFDNFGVEKYHKSHVEASTYILRVIKYRDPQSSETNIGCGAHTDISFTTILHQNQVSGLQIKTKDGEWIDVAPSTNCSFIVMAAYSFTVWSNGRVHAPMHQVVMKGDKTRYSIALFSYGTWEFIDEEHPLKYKRFDNIQSAAFFSKSKGSLPMQ
ncbi:hypothetical protein RJ639_001426 [Escallonia herrerae]|uniref:Fe2OG dioxygenase domain-containing protein n=1 Tax=Escallonia herrerae TaxID=1293975 RepID=A0AA88X7S7_9ASTE|nr:hypothetical protein RJ639_001426 [Escallonia herrerae]